MTQTIIEGEIPELRKRQPKESAASSSAATAVKADAKYNIHDSIQVLKAGLRTVRHHTCGWLKEDLMREGKLDGSKESLYAKVFADYNAQKIYIRAQQDIVGEDFNPLKVMPGRDNEGKFSFMKNVDVPKNYLSMAYLLYAYDLSPSTFKRLRLREGAPLEKQVPQNKGQSVLVGSEFAATVYTARFFFVQHKMKKWIKDNTQAKGERRKTQRKTYRALWVTEKEKDPAFGAVYEK